MIRGQDTMVDLSKYTHVGTITETIANIKNFSYYSAIVNQ
ncbi:MAG: hypothetical protein ACI8WT_004942 [Clostridium sp.]|jgi:hypothetical protein